MERDKCDSCKYAMSVGDAFSKYGLITQMEYKVYTRSAYPNWPIERIRKIEQSFALCKKTKDFVEREDFCDMWEFRNDLTDFGCL